jgi:hypothetical protein
MKATFLLFTLLSSLVSYAQHDTKTNSQHGLVNWMSFKEAQEANKKQSKPLPN